MSTDVPREECKVETLCEVDGYLVVTANEGQLMPINIYTSDDMTMFVLLKNMILL